jgi:hypothetical protein
MSGKEPLEGALRDGVISREQYDVLAARMRLERREETSERTRRRILWVGLVLLGILVIYLAGSYLIAAAERLVVVSVGLVATAIAAIVFWRDPEKFELSRGLVGLAVVEAAFALVLVRQAGQLPQTELQILLAAVCGFGVLLGIHQNSTWLASPSFFAFYAGFFFVGVPYQTEFQLAVLGLSLTIAAIVPVILWAWHEGQLRSLQDAYVRRQRALGQIARGHLVLFGLYLPFGLLIASPRIGLPYDGYWLYGLPSFGIALLAILYARWRTDEKLLMDASILLALVSWLFLYLSRSVYTWPLAVFMTAAVLIYLGVRRGRLPVRPTAPAAGDQRRGQ